jgi:hypothetical protein
VERKAHKELPVVQGPKEARVLKDHKVPQVQMELTERKVVKDLRVLKVQPAALVLKAHKAPKDHKALQVLRE